MATGAVVGTTDIQTLTNKTISGAANTLSNVPLSALPALSSTYAHLTDSVNGRGPVLTSMPGNRNEALGAGALVANTAGQKNVAIGYAAMAADTGSFNTAVGESALAANTSGSQNVALGQGALHANVSGGFNTGVGVNALGVATGSNNTVMGWAAAAQTSTGTTNAGFGYNVLSQQTTGSNNAAFGASALPGGSATNNAAFGYNALGGLGAGLRNTGVGENSGPYLCNSEASDNVAIGVNSLAYSGPNSTFWSQRQVAIGNSSGMSVPDYRYDTATVTLGSSTVLDATIGAGDAGKPICASISSTGPQVGLGIGRYVGSGANTPTVGVSFTIVDSTNTPVLATVNRSQVMVGTTQVNGITAVGYAAVAGGAYASAIGYLASAGASGAVALGTDHTGAGATTTTQDEIALGTASHTARIAGWLRLDKSQTTVGAAGAASALPATPTKYLSVKDSTGTEYVMPVYAKV